MSMIEEKKYTASKMIKDLERFIQEHGDLPIFYTDYYYTMPVGKITKSQDDDRNDCALIG